MEDSRTMADLIEETRGKLKRSRTEVLVNRLRKEKRYAETMFHASQSSFSQGRYWEGYLEAVTTILNEVEKLL